MSSKKSNYKVELTLSRSLFVHPRFNAGFSPGINDNGTSLSVSIWARNLSFEGRNVHVGEGGGQEMLAPLPLAKAVQEGNWTACVDVVNAVIPPVSSKLTAGPKIARARFSIFFRVSLLYSHTVIPTPFRLPFFLGRASCMTSSRCVFKAAGSFPTRVSVGNLSSFLIRIDTVSEVCACFLEHVWMCLSFWVVVFLVVHRS